MERWMSKNAIRRELDYIPTEEDMTMAFCAGPHMQRGGIEVFRFDEAVRTLTAYYRRISAENKVKSRQAVRQKTAEGLRKRAEKYANRAAEIERLVEGKWLS